MSLESSYEAPSELLKSSCEKWFPVKMRNIVTYVMAFIFSSMPQLALAESAQTFNMVSTSSVVSDMTLSSEVEELLNNSEVQKQLVANGLTQEEATKRLAALSPAEMNQLSLQIQEARAGGDILFTILIVVLIIFLVQRI